MFSFSFSCTYLLHGNCLLTRFNFSIKILLAKTTLFWTFLCYLLNMSLFCIGSIFWCCFIVPLFHCSSHVPVFCSILIVLPVFWFSASVSVFCQCSTSVPCSIILSSGVPGFIVCPKIHRNMHFCNFETKHVNWNGSKLGCIYPVWEIL